MLHDSVTTKLFTLPGETMVYPGHDYRGRASSTIDQEKSFNWRFTKTRGEFVSYMSRLNLPCPKCLDVVVAANLSCGALDMREVEESIASQPELGIHVPDRPGDIGLCGDLPKEALKKIAGRYASWVYLNMKSNPAFMPEELKSAGVQSLEVWPFPSQFLPSEANTRGALAALDKLPRPLMLQCSGGNRAGALLLLWLAKKQGRSWVCVRGPRGLPQEHRPGGGGVAAGAGSCHSDLRADVWAQAWEFDDDPCFRLQSCGRAPSQFWGNRGRDRRENSNTGLRPQREAQVLARFRILSAHSGATLRSAGFWPTPPHRPLLYASEAIPRSQRRSSRWT